MTEIQHIESVDLSPVSNRLSPSALYTATKLASKTLAEFNERSNQRKTMSVDPDKEYQTIKHVPTYQPLARNLKDLALHNRFTVKLSRQQPPLSTQLG